LGVFGEAKLRGENVIIHSGCKYVIIRTSWLYSLLARIFEDNAETDCMEIKHNGSF
jgi:dTDP-4-dehydrorhamnose reductase